jgi:signal recognition particle subunit SRP54
LKEICAALLESDVNVRLVQTLRKSIKHKVDFNNLPAGSNRKRYIAKAVFDELVALVDTHEKPYEPKPKKSNVIMLVGLQGAGKTTTCTKVFICVYMSNVSLRCTINDEDSSPVLFAQTLSVPVHLIN